ncbi:MAG: ImmA/IrrE family metallo-endopeptidase [Patescibacteria group bacterium]|nr:ImmA/IrrE family metallo-endopeptidase [Patescibacteria group bacterium]
MEENIKNAIKKGEEIALKYNPDTLIPFPFEKILKDEGDLKIEISDLLQKRDDSISGLLAYRKIEGKDKFGIFINNSKSQNRIYFTIAHELGHYFLHKKKLIDIGLVIDNGQVLEIFRLDTGLSDEEEIEANNFAATLIMPADKVREIWNLLHDVDECAKFFQVSVLAMSIRLNNLKLID